MIPLQRSDDVKSIWKKGKVAISQSMKLSYTSKKVLGCDLGFSLEPILVFGHTAAYDLDELICKHAP